MAKPKRKVERFIGIPYHVANSDVFGSLRSPETKLVLDVLLQYTGKNNGMLSPCLTLMKKRGWAAASLHRAFRKLLDAGFFVVTRQGYKIRGMATLVALTWNGIDEPRNKVVYDEGILPSHQPLGYWCMHRASWKHQPKATKKIKSSSPKRSTNSELLLQGGEAVH